MWATRPYCAVSRWMAVIVEKSSRQKTAPVAAAFAAVTWSWAGGLEERDSMLGRCWLDNVGATVDAFDVAISSESRQSKLVAGVLVVSTAVNVRLLLLCELAYEGAAKDVAKLLRRWSTMDETSSRSGSLEAMGVVVYI